MSAIDDPTTPEHSRAFAVDASIAGTRATVRPRGELDLATAPQVEQHVSALWSEGAETVVLDLGAVSFFDSSALRLLMRLQTQAADNNRGFLLRDCSPAVMRVLELTRLDDRFAVDRGVD